MTRSSRRAPIRSGSFSHAQAGLKGTDPVRYAVQLDLLNRVAQNGGYLCFDDFPAQKSTYMADAIELICALVAAGHGDRIILSNDCHWTHRRGAIRVRGREISASSRTYDKRAPVRGAAAGAAAGRAARRAVRDRQPKACARGRGSAGATAVALIAGQKVANPSAAVDNP
ncbi:hypothetical protein [Bradyrhizobium sp.]|uniref:phosphotriesterase family protein n=1 Tax=Bradyrhizobium sp. TaxID=376 RepID=UPI001EB69119|nr:hypothetical protein [Bradyrhizobium sp.]